MKTVAALVIALTGTTRWAGGAGFEDFLRETKVPEKIVFPEGADPESGPFGREIALYRRVSEPFRRLLERGPVPSVDYQTHEEDYGRLREAVFARQGGPFTDRVLSWRWGGWCGTGSHRFLVPHSQTLLCALVADERWCEAAGAALALSPETDPRLAWKILEACPGTPEEILTGGLALAMKHGSGWELEAQELPLLALMAGLPGDEKVRRLIELASVAPAPSLSQYFQVLGKCVPRGPQPNGRWGIAFGGSGLHSVTAGKVSAEGQKMALDFLCAQASPKLPVDAAKTLAEMFFGKHQPAMIDAARRLLDHPSQSVADAAARVLTDAGESFPVPKKPGPLRYRILVNGTPYANRKVDWTVPGLGAQVTTTAEGIAEIPRDFFLDHPEVRRFALRSGELPSMDDPWFGVMVVPTPGSDSPVDVRIVTEPTRIRLQWDRPLPELASSDMTVVLWGEQSADRQKLITWSPATFTLPVQPQVVFPQLAPGTYRLEIRIPGCESWTGLVTAGKTVEVSLKRASDVRFSVTPPAPWRAHHLFRELHQDGRRISADWDHQALRFRGVPTGSYVLRIPSSHEIRSKVIGLLPDGPEFEGREIPFEVSPSSPPVMDLGSFELKPSS
jgi:hypothetical protein